ncbi:MAG TPA: hypothetical protein DCE65_00465 [Clostridiales bacterium]|nr:hypothetical protein [Clostridiales bacterium]
MIFISFSSFFIIVARLKKKDKILHGHFFVFFTPAEENFSITPHFFLYTVLFPFSQLIFSFVFSSYLFMFSSSRYPFFFARGHN